MIPADRQRHGLAASLKMGPDHFTRYFAIALIAGLILAAVLSPFAACGLGAADFHLPFPRIFDRTMMVTLALALILCTRRLQPWELLRRGFTRPVAHLGQFAAALAIALAVIGGLFAIAAAIDCANLWPLGPIAARAAKYAAAALLISLIEEGFFRALLLAGISSDYGPRAALLGSSAFFAVTHIVRSPAHFYLTGFHPLAGFQDLGLSATRLAHPVAAMPALTGLFLLGIVLGEAFILTGTVYFSVGLHAGFVIGAKTWPAVARHPAAVPQWLARPGPVPLIAAPAAWIAAAAIALSLPFFLRQRSQPD